MAEQSLTENKLISKSLTKQVEQYIDSLKAYNALRPRPRFTKDYLYLEKFFLDFIRDQNKRALEIESEKYKTILFFAREQFPLRTMFNLCIDGRTLPVLEFGASAVFGSSVRVPGGMLRDFIRGTDGQLKLSAGSYYAKLLHKAFKRHEVTRLAEVYDSHVGCAARLVEEQAKGRNPGDAGLFSDISHKKQIAEATSRYCQTRWKGQKMVVPVQVSFDPQSGYLWMGLETEKALEFVLRRGKEFTQEVLLDLLKQGKVISTKHLASIPQIKRVLEEYFFPLDWKSNYITSADQFWHAVAAMKSVIYPLLESEVLRLYPHLKENATAQILEKEERIMLLLSNLFSGFLHTHSVKGKGSKHLFVSSYPYTAHEEEGVNVSEGGYPPNDIAMFVVFSLDTKNLSTGIELAASLVRKNRTDGRVVDKYGIFSDRREFVEASVPVVMQEIVRDVVSIEEWKFVESVSWEDLPENWEKMTDAAFLKYLHEKAPLPAGVILGVNNLRRRMAVLYDLGSPSSSHIIEHYKVVLPIITGRYRMHHFIVPFVKHGFA